MEPSRVVWMLLLLLPYVAGLEVSKCTNTSIIEETVRCGEKLVVVEAVEWWQTTSSCGKERVKAEAFQRCFRRDDSFSNEAFLGEVGVSFKILPLPYCPPYTLYRILYHCVDTDKHSASVDAFVKRGRVERGDGRVERGDGRVERGDGRLERGDGRVERGDGRVERGDGRVERGDGRVEKSDGRVERGDGSHVPHATGVVEESGMPANDTEIKEAPSRPSTTMFLTWGFLVFAVGLMMIMFLRYMVKENLEEIRG